VYGVNEFYNDVLPLQRNKLKRFAKKVTGKSTEFMSSDRYADSWQQSGEQENTDLVNFLITVMDRMEGYYGKSTLLKYIPTLSPHSTRQVTEYILAGMQKTREYDEKKKMSDAELEFLNLLSIKLTAENISVIYNDQKLFQEFRSFMNCKTEGDEQQKKQFTKIKTLLFSIFSRPEIYTSLPNSYKVDIFRDICNLENQSAVKYALPLDTLKHLPIDEAIMTELFSQYKDDGDVSQPGNKKKKAKEATQEEKMSGHALNVLLERLSSLDKIQGWFTLLTHLFNVLPYLFKNKDSNTIDSEDEYTVMICLSTMKQIISNSKGKTIPKHIMKDINIDDLLRMTNATSSQSIHNEVIIIMGYFSELAPTLMAQHMIPLLTYMSKSVSRRGDANTWRIIRSALETILPSVEATFPPRKIISVFVQGFHSIPVHQRTALYKTLLDNVKSQENLTSHTVLSIFARQVSQSEVIPNWSEGLADFAHEMCNELELSDATLLLQDILDTVVTSHALATEQEKTEFAKRHPNLKPVLAEITALEDKSVLAHAATEFIADHISSTSYLKRLLDTKNLKENIKVQNTFLGMFEMTLQHLDHISKSKYEDTTLYDIAVSILESLNQLLANSGFVKAVTRLLKHNDTNIRTRALVLLNDKLEKELDSLTEREVEAFISMVPEFSEIITKPSNSKEANETKQTALLSLEILARNFTVGHEKKFSAIIPHLISGALQQTNAQVCASGSLCLASLVSHLGVNALPVLSKVVNSIVERINTSMQSSDDGKSLLILSLLSSLDAIVTSLSNMMTPYVSSIMKLILEPSFSADDKLSAQLSRLSNSILKGVEPKSVVAAMTSRLAVVKKSSPEVMISLLKMVPIVAARIESVSMEATSQSFYKIFVTLFEKIIELDAKDDAIVEDSIECFVKMILRLREDLFRPMFLKLMEWCNINKDKIDSYRDKKVVFFYRTLNHMAKVLKSIACTYFSYVVEHMTLCLETDTNTRVASEKSKGKKKSKKSKAFFEDDEMDVEPKSTTTNETTKYILESFKNCFANDDGQFVNVARFRQLLPVLVDHLGFEENAIEATSQLATCVNEELMWKEFNHKILYTTRNENNDIKLACLDVLVHFYTHLGEQVLSIVPESVPFLSELMEDTDDRVEEKCGKLIELMEGQLGKDSITSVL